MSCEYIFSLYSLSYNWLKFKYIYTIPTLITTIMLCHPDVNLAKKLYSSVKECVMARLLATTNMETHQGLNEKVIIIY